MIAFLTTIVLSQLTTSPFMGILEAQNMIYRQTGRVDAWNYSSTGGFLSVAPQSQSQLKARARAEEKKNPDGKIECGENCLCTKLTEAQVKEILDFIKAQKERQAQFERFRQQNPNGGFRGRPQPKGVE